MPYLTANVGAEEWATYVLEGLTRESVVLAAGARRIVTSAKSIHVPIAGGAATQWLNELEEITQDNAVPTEVELIPKKVGNLSIASNEAIGDASVDVLDTIGDVAVHAISLEVDRALLAGLGTSASKQPRGLIRLTGLPTAPAASVDFAGLVGAAGTIRAAGGRPDTVFVHPTQHTALTLAADGLNRPLTRSTEDGFVEVIAGLRVFATPAMPAGQALVAQADQVLVAVRDDARVDISADARFAADAVAIRTVARVDVGVADLDALMLVGTAA